jgi:pimeloyl-ACP methyl ester carboxylesterase
MGYVELGEKDGDALILLHGLTDSARSWSDSMELIYEKDPGLHVIAVDQRGHGAASMPDAEKCADDPQSCFKPEQFAEDLIAFMDAKGIDKAAIAGHSMGSLIAQELALRYPERISAIILVASAASSKDNPVLRDYVLKEPVEGSWKQALAAKGIASPQALYEATPLDADLNVSAWLEKNWVTTPYVDSAVLQGIANETSQVKLGTWIGATKALLAYDNRGRLADLKVPTLVLWGTQDTIFLNDPDQKALMSDLKKAREDHGTRTYWKQYGVHSLADSGVQTTDLGHNLQWEAPGPVADDILSFLKTGKPTKDQVKAGERKASARYKVTPGAATIIGE